MGEISVPITSASGKSSAKSLLLLARAGGTVSVSKMDVHSPNARSRANVDGFLFPYVSAC